jgi:putative transposase
MTRIIKFYPGEYFHTYNRGINKMSIFNSKYDYQRFEELLYTTNSKITKKLSDIRGTKPQSPHPVWTEERGETLVDIGAYCLMPNHFHILIKSKNEKDTALFFQRLQMSHSKYFNKKNNRTGVLFQGKIKSEHVISNEYLKYLFAYIHLNPVKLIQKDWKESGIKNQGEAKKYLYSYEYSSFLCFLTEQPKSSILNFSVFPQYFENREDFKKHIFEWISTTPLSTPGVDKVGASKIV